MLRQRAIGNNGLPDEDSSNMPIRATYALLSMLEDGADCIQQAHVRVLYSWMRVAGMLWWQQQDHQVRMVVTCALGPGLVCIAVDVGRGQGGLHSAGSC